MSPAPETARDSETPIFIGGMPRSGTTLLRAMIDSHPDIACGPELRVTPAIARYSAELRRSHGAVLSRYYGADDAIVCDAFAGLINDYLQPYRRRRGRPRLAEKTPANAFHFHEIAALFPAAKLVMLVRDARDVVASLKTMQWRDDRTGSPLEITRNSAAAAAQWAHCARLALGAYGQTRNLLTIRYENLVADPEPELRRLFAHLGVNWCDSVLDFHMNDNNRTGANEASAPQISRPLYRQSVGRWRTELSSADKSAIRAHANKELIALGYADDAEW